LAIGRAALRAAAIGDWQLAERRYAPQQLAIGNWQISTV
jgi:hypothetical protein